MALNPGQSSNRNEHNWNYSRPNQPGFSTELTGTVVAMQDLHPLRTERRLSNLHLRRSR